MGGEQIEFLFFEQPGTVILSASSQNSVAILHNATNKHGTIVMISSLIIIVLPSLDQQGHSITCTNVGIGTKIITKFWLAGIINNVY